MATGRTVNNRGDRVALEDVTLVAVDAHGNATPHNAPLTVELRRRVDGEGDGGDVKAWPLLQVCGWDVVCWGGGWRGKATAYDHPPMRWTVTPHYTHIYANQPT